MRPIDRPMQRVRTKYVHTTLQVASTGQSTLQCMLLCFVLQIIHQETDLTLCIRLCVITVQSVQTVHR